MFKFKKITFSLLILALFFITPFASEALIFRAINVGQGDSFLFKFDNGQTMLVDAGGREYQANVIRALKEEQIKTIDLLVATHPHEDHIGGMIAVLDEFNVEKVWDSGFNLGSKVQERFLSKVLDVGTSLSVVKKGDIMKFGEEEVEVIAPVKTITGTNSDANNNCIVLLISTSAERKILMMGDAEAEQRKTMGRFPLVEIIKISHHGSSNGTDTKLLNDAKPDVAIISYGLNNTYGHPHQKTLKLLEDRDIKIYNTTGKDLVAQF